MRIGAKSTGKPLFLMGGMACFAISMVASSVATETPVKTIDFNRDVRPIISKCLTCHGHDPATVVAGLRLDTFEGATAVLRSKNRAIVPGHPEQSELIARINAEDPDDLMPPVDSNKTLSKEERAVLERWILEGAEYKEHWAFVKPERPTLPPVKNTAWATSPIDRFILAKLEAAGGKPSPEADRRTLIRRVTLDVTGLPPTESEINAFLGDTSPTAYERVVDRLLASPRYGERMAMDWMDYARYADSNGYQADFERFQWRWRDWVIDAFNSNMPYDRFTVEQLAGDMLPNASLDQVIATGFNRNHRINTEGGVIAEEWRIETVIDRVETTSATWLGLTTGCARCHDHKYDPVTQKDFYRLFAYFNNVPESGTGEERPVNHPPFIDAPNRTQIREQKQLVARMTDLRVAMNGRLNANAPKAAEWNPGDAPVPVVTNGRLARYLLANSPAREGAVPEPKVDGTVAHDLGRASGAVGTSDKGFVDLGSVADTERDQPFSMAVWINPNQMSGSPVARMDSSKDYRGWDLFMSGDRPTIHIISKWPENALKVVAKTPIQTRKWTHVAMTYDGSSKASGIHLYLDGKPVDHDTEADTLSGSIRTAVSTKIGRRTGSDVFDGKVDDLSLYGRVLSGAEVARLADVSPATVLLKVPLKERTKQQIRAIGDYWSLNHDQAYQSMSKELGDLTARKSKLDAAIPSVMVMKEMSQPRKAFVLNRGLYDKPGEEVGPGIPSFLPPLPTGSPNNRLGFAKWVASPANPLTSRVAVNRIWERLFGVGIVETSEDFGTRASFPSHPELLDWLATEFVAKHWDLKAMTKEILMSATYRQKSDFTPWSQEHDPQNRLLSRGPRFRLQGEILRDQALASAGLLKEKVGGPSVRPYQPDGIWDELNVYGNLRNYKHDQGDNLYRRSLYTIWKRTAAPPNMTIFDVPTRETCRVRRARTNTPLQALAMLNDVTFVEAARALAQRMIEEGGSTVDQRLSVAYVAVLARKPRPDEANVLRQAVARHLAQYRSHPDQAAKLISEGDRKPDPAVDKAELAAYTMVASTVLNLDEAVTKE